MWCLLPWLGTYSFFAMERFLKLKCADKLGLKGMDSCRPYYIQFTMKAEPKEFFSVLFSEVQKDLDPMELVYDKEVPLFEKYDEFVPPELIRKGFAYGILGITEMKERILSWKKII
jgi:ATP-dependent Lhr-like helicase